MGALTHRRLIWVAVDVAPLWFWSICFTENCLPGSLLQQKSFLILGTWPRMGAHVLKFCCVPWLRLTPFLPCRQAADIHTYICGLNVLAYHSKIHFTIITCLFWTVGSDISATEPEGSQRTVWGNRIFLLLYVFWGVNTGHQAFWQALLPSEPSYWPAYYFE